MKLVCFAVEFASVSSSQELWSLVQAERDDVILLDWHLVEAETPELVRASLARNPRLRIVAFRPKSYRQYRQSVWMVRRMHEHPAGTYGSGMALEDPRCHAPGDANAKHI